MSADTPERHQATLIVLLQAKMGSLGHMSMNRSRAREIGVEAVTHVALDLIGRVEELEAQLAEAQKDLDIAKGSDNSMQQAFKILTEPVLRLWESDPHQFSSRPCSTCQAITSIVGRSFGCNARRH